ncbi:transposase [Planktothrix mougeotii]|uniref:Transposase n=1 Tax=Planktothrix mougeotii LEGE 06226 TaxID=1828728 RepID=A0ABR9UHL6_9CYAN|nr:transposase [Planktothrix mougeotii]MBE9145957.1 transposase [Planktothrix mougeotii LEGE 06226]
MTLYKNKYRIESTRLPHHNYAANGWYFVTICTKDKLCFLSDIVSDNIQFSAIGEIAHKFWSDIPNHFQDVYLDAYIIMPNHVHGIIVIERSQNQGETHGNHEETRRGTSLQKTDESNKFAPLKPGSLQAIINAYKSSVTRWCRKNGYDNFAWQPRFYDHIIRDEQSLAKIQEYIVNNPAKWNEDQDNPANLWM